MSVVEVLLVDVGWRPLHHGIDLLMLSPAAGHVLAIEVKGTLRPGVVPRWSRRAHLQMSAAWMDKADDPGMAQWDLQSVDVYGGVVPVNFADMAVRAADVLSWRPVAAKVDIGEPR